MAITIPTDAYCDLNDVREMLPRRTFSATSTPLTDAQAEEHIKDTAALMSAVLRRIGYTTPITDTDGKNTLRIVNRRGAAAAIEQALQNAASASIEGAALEWQRQFEADMKALAADRYDLGAPTPSAARQPSIHEDLLPGGAAEDPAFTRAMKF